MQIGHWIDGYVNMVLLFLCKYNLTHLWNISFTHPTKYRNTCSFSIVIHANAHVKNTACLPFHFSKFFPFLWVKFLSHSQIFPLHPIPHPPQRKWCYHLHSWSGRSQRVIVDAFPLLTSGMEGVHQQALDSISKTDLKPTHFPPSSLTPTSWLNHLSSGLLLLLPICLPHFYSYSF